MSGGWSSTRNAQPWLKPALGARTALASARSTTAGSTGVSAYSRIMRRRRTTSWNSMEPSVPDHFEQMWADLAPVGAVVVVRRLLPAAVRDRRARADGVVRRAGDRPRAAARGRRASATGRVVGRRGYRRRACVDRVAPRLGARRRSVRRAARGGVGAGGRGPAAGARVPPARPIGVSVFVEEEGSRFGLACLGLAARDRSDLVVAGPARCATGDGVRLDEAMAVGRARRRGSPALVGTLTRIALLRGAPRRAGARPGRPGRGGRGREPDLAARALPLRLLRRAEPRRDDADGGPPATRC